MEKRDKKRLIIAAVYAVIFILILIPVIAKIIPNDSCSDGIRNQNEEGVDCGGVCPEKCKLNFYDSIIFGDTGAAESGVANKYDVYGEITNSNKNFGSSQFEYTFKLKDASGNVLAQRDGRSFIFPGEKKYLVEIGIISEIYPAKVDLEIKNMVWKDFAGVQKPQLVIVNKNFNEADPETGLSDAIGLLRNESPFDFNEIKIQTIVKNTNGKIVALNSTKINTVQSGENREFKALWPSKIFGVGNMEVQAETNVFDESAFIEYYFPGQSF